jgi:hypothetical protein
MKTKLKSGWLNQLGLALGVGMVGQVSMAATFEGSSQNAKGESLVGTMRTKDDVVNNPCGSLTVDGSIAINYVLQNVETGERIDGKAKVDKCGQNNAQKAVVTGRFSDAECSGMVQFVFSKQPQNPSLFAALSTQFNSNCPGYPANGKYELKSVP